MASGGSPRRSPEQAVTGGYGRRREHDADRATNGESRVVDLDGPVHYVDFGGPATGPAVVLVHGLGGSHLNWDLLRAAAHRRTRASGRSTCPGSAAASPAPARPACRRTPRVAATGSSPRSSASPAVLVGNSMGGMLSILATRGATRGGHRPGAARPRRPRPAAGARPAGGADVRDLRRPVRGRAVHAACGAPGRPSSPACARCSRCAGSTPTRVPPEVIDRSVTLLQERRGRRGHGPGVPGRGPLAAAPARRPAALPPGDGLDPACRCCWCTATATGWSRSRRRATSPARHPDWRYLELAGVGHVPQLQVPERLAAEVLGWLDETADARAAR